METFALLKIDKILQWKRFPALTRCLKGFRQGELTILTGHTGTGKTTFLAEYSLDLCMQGVSTLWGSFEMTNRKLTSVMLRQFARSDFDHTHPKFAERFHLAWDQFEQLPLTFLNYHGATNPDVLFEEIKRMIASRGIQHVIIDNLQFMLGMSFDDTNDRFLKQDGIIQRFRELATRTNVHVTLVCHPRKVILIIRKVYK